MRIGLFTSDFPFREPFELDDREIEGHQWGGVAEVVYNLAISLNEQGHTVKVFTVSPTRKDMVQKHERITVYRYGKEFKVASTLLSSRLLWKPMEHQLDVAHGHLGTPPGAYAALAYSKVRSKPLIVTLHTTYNDVSLEGGSPVRKMAITLFEKVLCPPLLRGADTITAVSLAVMNDTPAFRPSISRARIVPNGIEIIDLEQGPAKEECRDRLGLGHNDKIVLYVGSLSEYKSPENLMDAFGRLAPAIPEARLVMLGGGPLRNELIASSRRMGVEGRVRLPGFVSEDDKWSYYRAADVFALPSRGDAFGIVLLEAAAFGLPLVATDLDVFRALVDHGRNGLLFAPGNDADLASKLSALLQDDGMRQEMGSMARATAERYDWKEIMGVYGELYRNVIGPGVQRPEVPYEASPRR